MDEVREWKASIDELGRLSRLAYTASAIQQKAIELNLLSAFIAFNSSGHDGLRSVANVLAQAAIANLGTANTTLAGATSAADAIDPTVPAVGVVADPNNPGGVIDPTV